METRGLEVLAPAGSLDSLRAAVAAGADAVYMGGTRFGARAYAQNPDEKGLLEGIDYVHLHGRKLYMTVNTLFKEEELKELYDYLLPYYRRGLDGVIVQDLGALRLLREAFPGLELHSSTQMTVTGVYGARMMKELGCSRVVTAREMSLEEIRRIRDEVGIEIESFVHGALCYCYSGQCLMSSLIGGRSGNRGRCAQPCRLPYSVEGKKSYLLSLKDLCTLDILPDILEAGVYALKIEGRMKSPRYTAGVVRIYRKYADLFLEQGKKGYRVEESDRRELLELFDRGGFTSGYYTKHNGRDMVALKEKPAFREGNQKLFDFLDKTYVEATLQEAVTGEAFLTPGEPARLRLKLGESEAQVSGKLVEPAKSQPMTADRVKRQLEKTGNTPFRFETLAVHLDGDCFLPLQALNELRREGLESLEKEILGRFWREEPKEAAAQAGREMMVSGGEALTAPSARPAIAVYLEEQEQLSAALACPEVARIYLDAAGFAPKDWSRLVREIRDAGRECYLALPQIFRTHAQRFFAANGALLRESGFDGLLLRALEEEDWLRREGLALPFGFDASVYGWNSAAVCELARLGADFMTFPWELNSRELLPVAAACGRERLGSELIVYGHAPMMVSAQCIVRTTKGCTGKPELLYMKDRTGAELPVKNRCPFCYNVILNPKPLSLIGDERLIAGLGPSRIRLSFTRESGEETKRILESYAAVFGRGETREQPVREFTRGHFKRGVE